MSYVPPGGIVYQDTRTRDLFSRLYVAQPFTLFDSKQVFDNAPLFWDEELESGAGISSAHSTATASTTITSTLNTAGTFTRQTFMRFNYQPGKEYGVFMTGVIRKSGSGTGTEATIGLIDDDNGLAFVDIEGTMHVRLRSSISGSAVNTDVTQASWNIDTLDGTGPSGITADWTKAQIFFIRFGWLGLNDPQFCIVVGGEIVPVHQVHASNVSTSVYMSTPNLPLRYQLVTTGSSPVTELEAICAEIHASGGQQANGAIRRASTGGTHIDLATEDQLYALMGLRLKSTHVGVSVDMLRAAVQVQTDGDNIEWVLVWNPQTVTGTFTYTGLTNSAMEVATASGAAPTVSIGTGFIIDGGFLASTAGGGPVDGSSGSLSEGLLNALRLGAAIDGTRDQIVLCARPIGGASAVDVEASLTWRELD